MRMKLFAARYQSDERGSFSVEAAMMLPMLCYFYVSTFVWFDAYRAQNTNLKAGYTIADLISRVSDSVDDDYLNGMDRIFDYLTHSDYKTYLRFTHVTCRDFCDDEAMRQLDVCWSWATPGRQPVTTDTFALDEKVPLIPKGDVVMVTETFMAYLPPFSGFTDSEAEKTRDGGEFYGMGFQTFEYQTVTRPRFAPQIIYKTAGGESLGCWT